MSQFSLICNTSLNYKIKKPIRLIELFAGIGSQAKALKNIDANFETYKVVEYDSNAIKSYNAIHNTDFVVQDITKINSSDLCIVDTNKYEYIMTYSFPCQDLSLAGNQKGMGKGNSTRSGLLWEVERLLKGCVELPQILLMENVPQVVGKANFKDFREWEIFLEGLGYSNYFKLLNAKDYGIPQNRNRCYMVSVLGNYYYEFPSKIKLKLRLKDMLEDEVDEKYYINADYDLINSENQAGNLKGGKWDKINESCRRFYDIEKIAPTIHTMGGGNTEPKIATRLSKTLEKNSIEDGDFIDSYNQIIRKGISGTITTRVSESNNTFVAVPEKTKRGYAEAHVGDGVYIDRPHQKREVVQKGMIQTIKTSGDDVGVVVKGNYSPSGHIDSNLRIRKLTPKECWRLMGFSDEDFEKASKVNSNSQLYKQAGNSIVVNVLEEIFKMLF